MLLNYGVNPERPAMGGGFLGPHHDNSPLNFVQNPERFIESYFFKESRYEGNGVICFSFTFYNQFGAHERVPRDEYGYPANKGLGSVASIPFVVHYDTKDLRAIIESFIPSLRGGGDSQHITLMERRLDEMKLEHDALESQQRAIQSEQQCIKSKQEMLEQEVAQLKNFVATHYQALSEELAHITAFLAKDFTRAVLLAEIKKDPISGHFCAILSVGLRAHVLASFTLISNKIKREPSPVESAITGALNIIASTVPFGGLLQLGALAVNTAFSTYEKQIYKKITDLFSLDNVEDACMDIALRITGVCQQQALFTRPELQGKTEGELSADVVLFLLDFICGHFIPANADPVLLLSRTFERAFVKPQLMIPAVVEKPQAMILAPAMMQWVNESILWLQQPATTLVQRQEFLAALQTKNANVAYGLGDALYTLFNHINTQGEQVRLVFASQLDQALAAETAVQPQGAVIQFSPVYSNSQITEPQSSTTSATKDKPCLVM
jgi:hypothetical protein